MLLKKLPLMRLFSVWKCPQVSPLLGLCLWVLSQEQAARPLSSAVVRSESGSILPFSAQELGGLIIAYNML